MYNNICPRLLNQRKMFYRNLKKDQTLKKIYIFTEY